MAKHIVKFISFEPLSKEEKFLEGSIGIRRGGWTHNAKVEVDGIEINLRVTLAWVPRPKGSPHQLTRGTTIRVTPTSKLVKQHPDWKVIKEQIRAIFEDLFQKEKISF